MQFIRALVSVLNVPRVILLSFNLQTVLDFIANHYFGSEWNLIVLNYIFGCCHFVKPFSTLFVLFRRVSLAKALRI